MKINEPLDERDQVAATARRESRESRERVHAQMIAKYGDEARAALPFASQAFVASSLVLNSNVGSELGVVVALEACAQYQNDLAAALRRQLGLEKK